MLTRYIEQALERANYEPIEHGSFCATVPGLRGVIATGSSIEVCRRNLIEVVEDWVLIRIADHLPVPRLGGCTVRVRPANRSR